MAEHRLPEGKRWIDNLLALGSALGYRPKDEYDVLAREDRKGPVDVAWFRSEDDRFPLFIFEIETRASGQMSHNAGKVFTQDTALFEKPLFLFHLIVEGSKENTRADVAEAAYGKFNYRIYSVADGEATASLCDILSQHRRISDRLDVSALAAVLNSENWPEIDLDRVWPHAEDCLFRGDWLRSYASLALENPDEFLGLFLRFLEKRCEEGAGAPTTGYDTFIGKHCGSALHAALLAENKPEQGRRWLDELRSWQEQDGIMKMAAPYPGLNEDGDNFVFALMPALWALFAAMFVEVEGADRWILEQMELVVSADTGLNLVAVAATAIWMLHIAAGREGGEKHFEHARERLNAEGGISTSLLAAPPSLGGYVADYDEWWERLQTEKALVPGLDEFRKRFSGSGASGCGTPIALAYLLNEQPPEAGQEIRKLLVS